jgi:putative transposase
LGKQVEGQGGAFESRIDREEARWDVFGYIEMFYNPKHRHSYADGLFPVQFEQHYFNRLGCV